MFIVDNLEQYRILDAGDGDKLESWNGIIMSRPDPQVIWNREHEGLWHDASAEYIRSSRGGGEWKIRRKLPEDWILEELGMRFKVKPTGFKHMGLFPEQAYNWQFIMEHVREGDNFLNLFAYTGGASVAAAKAGAKVTHVDASKGIVQWAKENAELSSIPGDRIRYIVDDCLKFVQREYRRGRKYEAIIMDPPSYGRGANKELWKLEDTIEELITECVKILSDDARLFILNSYTTGLSNIVTRNLLQKHLGERGGRIEADDLAIPIEDSKLFLPCGATARWYV